MKDKNQERLTIALLKDNLTKTIGSDLIREGFKIDSKSYLKKKFSNGAWAKIGFDCYSFPVRLEFSLIVTFWLPEIEKEIEKFRIFSGQTYFKSHTYICLEGGFRPELQKLEPKYQTGFQHHVFDQITLDNEIADCRNILQKFIIPIIPTYTNLEKYQEFILGFSSIDVFRHSGVVPTIMAAKLKSAEAVSLMLVLVWKLYDLDHQTEDNTNTQLFWNLVEFLQHEGILQKNFTAIPPTEGIS